MNDMTDKTGTRSATGDGFFGLSQYERDPAPVSEEELIAALAERRETISRVCGTVKRRPFYNAGKRFFDIIASLVSLILLSPVFLIISLRIRADSPGGAIFRQKRVGLNGKVFTMYKFRSMVENAEEQHDAAEQGAVGNGPMFKNPRDPRVTPLGAKLRKYSVDELPQLVNVLRGEMSFIGPRPPLVREVLQYEDDWLLRLSVKGGLSGLWQVERTSNADFEECLRLDKRYIERRGWLFDLGLIFRTLGAIRRGNGC